MELPTIGGHCEFLSCQTLDFLPFQCSFCSKTFCSPHRLPQNHACAHWSMESHASSVQLCTQCERMVLTPKLKDPMIILKEHNDSGCSRHLLPPAQSIAVLCARPRCNRRDRVVQTCLDCGQTFCLGHRHPTDHDCPKIEGRKREAEAEEQRKRDIMMAIRARYTAAGALHEQAMEDTAPALVISREVAEKDKLARSKANAEAAKSAIADAKAKVAARSATGSSGAVPITGSGTSSSSRSGSSGSVASTVAPAPPKVKKVSRVVSVMKLKKLAQGEDKIPLGSRIYLHIRSPALPQVDDKAIYLDKAWTVGRSLDKLMDWLKIKMPRNEPFDAQKRFSIFHAKEKEDTPTILNMQDRLQHTTQVESGDIFYLATADWKWPSK